jgi:hypothetical protein
VGDVNHSRACGGATIRVRAPSGRLRTFDAERVEIAGDFVTAVGTWRHDREPVQQRVAWPAARLLEIRWRAAVTA